MGVVKVWQKLQNMKGYISGSFISTDTVYCPLILMKLNSHALDRGGAANFKVVRPGSGCGLGVALFQLVIAIMTIL